MSRVRENYWTTKRRERTGGFRIMVSLIPKENGTRDADTVAHYAHETRNGFYAAGGIECKYANA